MSTHTPISNTFAIRQKHGAWIQHEDNYKAKCAFMLGDTNTVLMSISAQEKMVNTSGCYIVEH